jgi:CheY-like chemotaxis protein
MILVVEDDPTILMLADDIIQELGHRTLTAFNGAQAEALLLTEAAIEALFTDIELGPGPNGLELSTTAVMHRPDIKVIYATAQPLTDGLREMMVEGAQYVGSPTTPRRSGLPWPWCSPIVDHRSPYHGPSSLSHREEEPVSRSGSEPPPIGDLHRFCDGDRDERMRVRGARTSQNRRG